MLLKKPVVGKSSGKRVEPLSDAPGADADVDATTPHGTELAALPLGHLRAARRGGG